MYKSRDRGRFFSMEDPIQSLGGPAAIADAAARQGAIADAGAEPVDAGEGAAIGAVAAAEPRALGPIAQPAGAGAPGAAAAAAAAAMPAYKRAKAKLTPERKCSLCLMGRVKGLHRPRNWAPSSKHVLVFQTIASHRQDDSEDSFEALLISFKYRHAPWATLCEYDHDAGTLAIKLPIKSRPLIDVIEELHAAAKSSGCKVSAFALQVSWSEPLESRRCLNLAHVTHRPTRPKKVAFAKECICDKIRGRAARRGSADAADAEVAADAADLPEDVWMHLERAMGLGRDEYDEEPNDDYAEHIAPEVAMEAGCVLSAFELCRSVTLGVCCLSVLKSSRSATLRVRCLARCCSATFGVCCLSALKRCRSATVGI